MPDDKLVEKCKSKCANAGITFARSLLPGKDVVLFPINVRGMVSEKDLDVPSSELSEHVGAANKKLLAWSVTDVYTHILYDNGEGCCEYTHGLPNELLSERLREVTHKILPRK